MSHHIKSRLVAPAESRYIIHRQRLLDDLRDNAHKSLIIIQAPAGSGKTTLARDFLSFSNNNFSWLRLSSDISAPITFIQYLILSIQKSNQSFGSDTLKLIESFANNPLIDTNDITKTFINELENNFNEDFYIVLDDLHNMKLDSKNEWVKEFFNILFEDLPENIHIIIISRELPDFNYTFLLSKRRCFELSAMNLAFTNEEASELIKEIYHLNCTETDINLLQSFVNGWVSGIHLVMQVYGPEYKNLRKDKIPDNIFDFFASEIFDKSSNEIKDFLLKTAMLDSFDLNICNFLFGNNGELILHEILHKNIFVERVAFSNDTFYYHDLFKTFLINKINKVQNSDETNNYLHKIADYYLSQEDKAGAVNYLIMLKEYSPAIGLIKDTFDEYFNSGKLQKTWNWLKNIPAEIKHENPFLLYFEGVILLYLFSNAENAIENFNKAINLFERENNTEYIIKAYIEKTEALYIVARIKEAINNLEYIKGFDASPSNSIRILYSLARACYRLGAAKYVEAIDHLNKALEICQENNIKSLKTEIFRLLGNIYLTRGDTTIALNYFERAISIESDPYSNFRILNNIIYLQTFTGNYKKAKEYLEQAQDLYNKYPAKFYEKDLFRNRAQFLNDFGDYEQAISNYKKVIENEINNNVNYYSFACNICISECYRSIGKLDLASEYCKLSLQYMLEDDPYQKLLYDCSVAFIMKRTEANDFIEKALLENYDYYKNNNLLSSQAQLEYHLADYYYLKEYYDTALQYLTNALNVSSEKQYISYLHQEITNSRYLFDFAVENNIQKDFIKLLFDGAKDKLNYTWLSCECRSRMAKEIMDLNDIDLTSFGKIEIKVRGKKVDEDKWTRKKSKLILIYLLTHKSVSINKSEIIDIFFQDVPLASVDTIFHNTLSNIRTAMKIEHPSYVKSKENAKINKLPVLVIYEDKTLRLNEDYYYVSDNLEFEKLFSKSFSPGSSKIEKVESMKQALDLYKGEFLPGYYDNWCEEIRHNYSEMFLKLSTEFINYLLHNKMYSEIIHYSTMLLSKDKLNETAYLALIEAYCRTNSLDLAKDRFALMLKYYDEELGAKPEKNVLNKIQNLLLDNLD